MNAMREIELETLRFHRVVHFVKRIDEPWSGRDGVAVTYCGRSASANKVEPRKFSTVRDWCLPCYWSRHKAIDREYGVKTA